MGAVVRPDFVTGRGYYLDTDSDSYSLYADASVTEEPPDVPVLLNPSWHPAWAFPYQWSLRIDWDTNTYTVVTPWQTDTGSGDATLNGVSPAVGFRCNNMHEINDATVGYKDGAGTWHYFTDDFSTKPDGWYRDSSSFPGTSFPVQGDVFIRSGKLSYPDGGVNHGGTVVTDSWRFVDMASVSPHGVYLATTIAGYGPANKGVYGSPLSYYTSLLAGWTMIAALGRPLRQFPRDDALGGSPRQGRTNNPTSAQGSARQGWINTYR